MKWSSWVQMVWCYHLREAHVPSSLFCLLNSGSKVFAQKCRMYLSILKIIFFSKLKPVFEIVWCYHLLPFVFSTSATAAAQEQEPSTWSPRTIAENFTPYLFAIMIEYFPFRFPLLPTIWSFDLLETKLLSLLWLIDMIKLFTLFFI